MDTSPTLSTRAFFWKWLWSSAAGFFLGALLGLVPLIVLDFMDGESSAVAIWLVSLFLGASIGFFSNIGPDGILKKRHIGRVRWRLSSTIGGAIGMSVFGFYGSLQISILVILIISLLMLGLIMGIAQWLALRQVIKSNPRLHLWPVFNCLAYALAAAAIAEGVGYTIFQEYGGISPCLGIASVVFSFMILGAIPAAGMAWILAREQKAEAAIK